MGFSLQYTIHFGETPPKPESSPRRSRVHHGPPRGQRADLSGTIGEHGKTGDLMVNNGE